MAKLKIYTFPDLVLAQKALPIHRVEKAYHKLADDMLETMYFAPGIGLAANQVGILERILVVDVDYDYQELSNRQPITMINPEIIQREGDIFFEEGCLSIPGFSAEVKRTEKIKMQYQDLDGLIQTLSAEGLLAVAVQHEIDHLEGKLFIDRLSVLKKEMVKKKLCKEREEREKQPEGQLLSPRLPPRKRVKEF